METTRQEFKVSIYSTKTDKVPTWLKVETTFPVNDALITIIENVHGVSSAFKSGKYEITVNVGALFDRNNIMTALKYRLHSFMNNN